MNISGIYKIINKVNGKYYIGSSKDIKFRWSEHKYDLRMGIHHNPHLQNSWIKYGETSFEFVIITLCHSGDVLTEEQKYLDIAKTERDKSYNLEFQSIGGELSEESKRKLSNSLKTFYRNNPEMRQHLSEVHTGYKQSKEHIENCASTKRGKNHWLYGKPYPTELREKLSGRNHWKYDFTIYKFYNTTNKDQFIGTRQDFCKTYNLHPSNVKPLIKLKRKTHKGWTLLG